MTNIEIFAAAKSLYAGGWRVTDKEDLKKEYNLTEQDAEGIAEYLDSIEKEEL